jgi:TonB-linked SusC/RagA family outer membrane protein
MVKGYKEYNQTLMLAQFELNQDLSFLVNGLTLSGLFNATRYSYFDVVRQYVPFFYQVGFYNKVKNTYTLDPINEASGEEYLSYEEGPKRVRAKTYIQARLNYNHDFNDVHGISGLLVFLMQNQVSGNAGSLQTSLPHRNIGVSGRFTYSFKNTYFGEFDFGYNGSERFDQSHRFGFFPSAGVAWQVSNENFWKGIGHAVTNLKLRATYGLIGNDAIGSAADRFFYLSEVDMDDGDKSAVFGLDNSFDLNGITVNRYSNPKISWETSYKANVGFDLGLFNNVNIVADFWKERRTNILMTRSYIPTTMGLNEDAIPQANVGQAEGKGVDLSLDYSQFFKPRFWMKVRANFTYAVSRFLVYEEPEYPDAPWKSRVGYPLSQRWGYIAEHLFVDNKEVANSPEQNFGAYSAGDIKYRDINRDGKITTLDQVPIGYPTSPEIVYGFGLSVGYKSFTFNCFFQGLARESFWIDYDATAPFVTYRYDDDPSELDDLRLKNQLLQAYANNHWSEDNRNEYALWPRLSTVSSIGNNNNSQRSTWFMRNGAFLRLKSVELYYTLPQEFTEKIHLKNVQFYISSLNLLSWSQFKLWDPEMAGNGLGYPVQRVFNLGTKISF